MSILQAIILGIVQGITEFLPISSSGHLIAFPQIFGWEAHGYDFDVMIHVATLLAIIVVMWDDVRGILKGLFSKKSEEGVLGWKIAVATIPAVIVGLIIAGSYIDTIRTVQIVAVNLIVWGVVLWAADYYSVRVKAIIKSVEKTSWKKAIIIGVAQAIALIPGSSRSGLTISAGLFAGMNREVAARFSFLIAIPAIAGAGVLAGIDLIENGFITPIVPLVVGFITAFLFGILAIKFLFKLIQVTNYKWFAFYRIILGVILLVFLV